jgi:competence protein ComEC
VAPKKVRTNDLSEVFTVAKQILIPGDSPASQEIKWDIALPSTLRILILGHHGSRTSTSDHLLSRLPNVRLAIASARIRKYGHPHAETIARTRHHGVALIKTESWGNIWIELKHASQSRK